MCHFSLFCGLGIEFRVLYLIGQYSTIELQPSQSTSWTLLEVLYILKQVSVLSLWVHSVMHHIYSSNPTEPKALTAF